MRKIFMKSGQVLMPILAVVATLLSSCKKDDDKGPSNYFSINDSKTEIKVAVFFYDPTPGKNAAGESYYRHEIALVSDGFVLDGSDLKGKGSGIDLQINGGTVNLDAGTYTFTGTEENAAPFQFWDGDVFENITTGQSGGQSYTFTSGKIVIAKSGDTYSVEVDGTAGGKTIKAVFIGPVQSAVRD